MNADDSRSGLCHARLRPYRPGDSNRAHLFALPRHHGGWSETKARHIAAPRLTDLPCPPPTIPDSILGRVLQSWPLRRCRRAALSSYRVIVNRQSSGFVVNQQSKGRPAVGGAVIQADAETVACIEEVQSRGGGHCGEESGRSGGGVFRTLSLPSHHESGQAEDLNGLI